MSSVMPSRRDQARRIRELEEALEEERETVRALVSGEVDAVFDSGGEATLLAAAQRALRQSEGQLRAVFEGALDGMLISTDEGTFLECNGAACLLLGVAREELLGRAWADFVAEGVDAGTLWDTLLRLGHLRTEVALERSDGARLIVELSARANITPGRHLSVLRDVTEHRRAETARRAAETQLRAVLTHAPVVVSVMDEQGVFTLVAGRGMDAIPLREEDLLGRSAFDVFRGNRMQLVDGSIAPAERVLARVLEGEIMRALVDVKGRRFNSIYFPLIDEGGRVKGLSAVATDVTDQETVRAELRQSHELVTALVSASPAATVLVDLEGRVRMWNPAAEELFGWTERDVLGRRLPTLQAAEFERMLRSIRRGRRTVHRRMRQTCRDGERIEVSVSTAPIRDGSGALVGSVQILVDMREQRQLEEQLVQAQKMEGIGRLAGGIAHDFNNMLSAIQGFAHFLRDDLPVESPLQDDVKEILDASKRASNLTKQLLAFGRKQVLAPRVVDVNEMVRGTSRMMRRLIREDVELELELSSDTGEVRVDVGQIEQVLMNLVVNARDAMPAGGRLTIATDRIDVAESADLDPGRYALIRVTDTGTGMDGKTLSRIFEPFFTTKESGKGTGLGLSTAYGIVKQSNGHLTAESTPDEGTTFFVYLPSSTGEPSRGSDVESLMPASLEGDETILVAEDEPMVRRLAAQILRRHGYDVHLAANGEEALSMARSLGPRLSLVLADVVLPQLNGRELAEKLQAERPDLQLLFMSGYLGDDVELPATSLVLKPFSPKELLRRVRSALDE